MIAALVGVVILIIVILAVLQPVTNTMIISPAANLGGYTTALTVAQQLPTFNLLVALALLAAIVIAAISFFGRG